VKQGVFAQSALIAFAVPGQLNNPLCKCLPRGFGVTARSKADPGSVYGLPSLIERSSQNANGLGIEYAVSVVMEKLVHFNTPSQAGARQVSQSSAPALEPADDGQLCVLAGRRASLVFPILKDLNNITNFPKPIRHQSRSVTPAAIAGVTRNVL